MSLHSNDLYGRFVLKKLAKQQRAKAMIGSSGIATAATLLGLVVGSGIAAASYFVERSSIPEPLGSLVVGIVVAILGILVGQWHLERRLRAVIELLKLDDVEAK